MGWVIVQVYENWKGNKIIMCTFNQLYLILMIIKYLLSSNYGYDTKTNAVLPKFE